MAEAILSMTLETLRNLLLEEPKFLYGVGDLVREIQRQLEMIKSYLEDADRRQHTNKTVRTWVKQVRRLAYRIEDVLETYSVEVASDDHGAGWCIENVLKRFAFVFCHCFALHNVGKEIEKIMSDINDLKKDRVEYGIQVLDGGQSSREANGMHTYAHNVEEHFIGMKDDIDKLVYLITGESSREANERQHKVISIWGMGGKGKTTLAREIFNHGAVRRSFEAFAWVCVTQNCQTVKVLEDIHKQLVGNYTQGGLTLHDVLKEKKCLVVLDDIWRKNDWQSLRRALPMTNTSKVLLTTRNKDVAKQGFLHEIGTLTEGEGWELLQAKALIRLEGQGKFIHIMVKIN